MLRNMLVGKIHRATITEANLNYVGSLTVDKDLLDAAGFLPNELVQIYNISNGERFETYLLEAEAGSGVVCLNGAAARKGEEGDLIIMVVFTLCDLEEAKNIKPNVVLVDGENRILEKFISA